MQVEFSLKRERLGITSSSVILTRSKPSGFNHIFEWKRLPLLLQMNIDIMKKI